MPSVFKGVTTSPCRDIVAQALLAAPHDSYYFPCAGRFGAVEAFIKRGGDPRKVYASDICLYSSLIGYLVDSSLDWGDLGLRLNGCIASDHLGQAAYLLVRMWIGQIGDRNQYARDRRDEALAHVADYEADVRDLLCQHGDSLRGIHYQIADVRAVILRAAAEPNAALYVNVPAYGGGYEKMFAAVDAMWSPPSVAQFSLKKERSLLLDTLIDSPCSALVYIENSLRKPPPPGWQTIFAQDKDDGRIDTVIANRKQSTCFAKPTARPSHVRPHEIYHDQEITPESVISFMHTDRETALYYRDLFVHRLGTTDADVFYLMLIDGRVVTACGMVFRDIYRQTTDYVGESFGISITSQRYKRLGKLFMLCLTCSEFQRFIENHNALRANIAGIQTTSITQHEEGKTDRSVMKMVSRTKLPNGFFRLVYRADFVKASYHERLMLWLPKWGETQREPARSDA
jgi:hypothetical protein